MKLKEEDCIKAMRANEDLIPFIKDAITQDIGGYVRLLASEFKDSIPIFEKENTLDIYLCLKGPLFHEEGLILERGETKKKEAASIFRNIEKFDEPPLPIPKIHNKEIVPGTNEILKAMYTFDRFGFKDKFDPQYIANIVENYRYIIKRVASIFDDVITVFLDIDIINKKMRRRS